MSPDPLHAGGVWARGNMVMMKKGMQEQGAVEEPIISRKVFFLLQELCGAVGPVEAILMPAPGMAEVIFKFKDDALEAFKKYNQRNLDGQPMMCKLQTTSRSRVASSGYGQRYIFL